ncbi:MAG: hypothetical protein DLM70_05260, partial [Chloroflexi bacterium]
MSRQSSKREKTPFGTAGAGRLVPTRGGLDRPKQPASTRPLWFLAEDRSTGDISGLCLCQVVPRLVWVSNVAVRPPWRSRGLGLALLRHAFAEYERRGMRRVELSVDSESPTGAPRLYERAGMHVDKILAGSACQTAVITVLCAAECERHAVRQYLREWLYDGEDKATPCTPEVDVRACFAPLLRWVLVLWKGDSLALAVDATAHGQAITALVVSVLYRGTAIPVGWVILPGTAKGAWMPEILRLLRQLRPAVPADMTVLVLADRGLWSPRLFKRITDLGWHPLLQLTGSITF